MTRDDWELILDQTPEDWDTRLVYSDWLEENDCYYPALAQRWLAENKKTPGPACVIEAKWHEASWFCNDVAGQSWLFKDYRRHTVLARWCIDARLFLNLTRYVVEGRRDRGHHNFYAKSWNSRREAEQAIARELERRDKIALTVPKLPAAFFNTF